MGSAGVDVNTFVNSHIVMTGRGIPDVLSATYRYSDVRQQIAELPIVSTLKFMGSSVCDVDCGLHSRVVTGKHDAINGIIESYKQCTISVGVVGGGAGLRRLLTYWSSFINRPTRLM